MSVPTGRPPPDSPPHPRRRLLARLPLGFGLSSLLSSMAFIPRAARADDGEALEDDEDVLFLPGIARQLDDARVEVDLQAWIHEKGRRRLLDAGLARYLGLKPGEMSPTDQLRFRRRTELFHAKSEQGTVLLVEFDADGPPVTMPPSDRAGRTGLRTVVALPPHAAAAEQARPWLRFHAVVTDAPQRRVEGRALLVPGQGLSVVTDIDDTIKKTEVRDTHRMMLNTFARTFEAVPGMARRYRELARQPHARFHYLSSSPLQLLPSLKGFLNRARFPAGSMHLRESTLVRNWIPNKGESRAHKQGVLQRLLADFPERRFLLVGDAGELDPEIYGEVARSHPQRVEAILIRDVGGADRNAQRYLQAFADVEPSRWHLFTDGTDWPLP
ncbi:phosphatidate phosphatase App1 family protein [Variovorax sp.]|uniref:phosphatidate phosphatase App1 family protein n=1 Tax=Variovorax sp. TaxID=1871043 RepID=UPI002D4D8ADB|nr:phosphatase domain-containing protein [Variovorax sp.]HYP84639.1 phosphatase domain-containing protein [Variovorax sp.]